MKIDQTYLSNLRLNGEEIEREELFECKPDDEKTISGYTGRNKNDESRHRTYGVKVWQVDSFPGRKEQLWVLAGYCDSAEGNFSENHETTVVVDDSELQQTIQEFLDAGKDNLFEHGYKLFPEDLS